MKAKLVWGMYCSTLQNRTIDIRNTLHFNCFKPYFQLQHPLPTKTCLDQTKNGNGNIFCSTLALRMARKAWQPAKNVTRNVTMLNIAQSLQQMKERRNEQGGDNKETKLALLSAKLTHLCTKSMGEFKGDVQYADFEEVCSTFYCGGEERRKIFLNLSELLPVTF